MTHTFQAIRQARPSMEIAAQIEQAIYSGRLTPGKRLASEIELARQFGVPRYSVRNALRSLETRGLISVRVGSGGGSFVARANVDLVAESISTLIRLKRMSLSDLAEARKVVEAAAVELATMRSTESEIRRLEDAIKRSRARSDLTSMAAPDVDFHVVLADCTGNEVLKTTVQAYRELLAPIMRELWAQSDRVLQRVHEEIVDAMRRRDADAARQLMLRHLAESERRLRSWLSAQARRTAPPSTTYRHGVRNTEPRRTSLLAHAQPARAKPISVAKRANGTRMSGRGRMKGSA